MRKHGQTQDQPLLKISGHSLIFRSLGPKKQLCRSHVIYHPPLKYKINKTQKVRNDRVFYE